jgi:hypothetical protein
LSDRVIRRAAQRNALGLSDSRGARFAQKWSGYPGPTFADMAAVPRWLMLPPEQQHRVAKVAGLLRHRAAIDRELSGPRLAMLAEAVGDDLLDAVCASNAGDGSANDTPLPRPDLIIAEGWDIMHHGLPPVFATRFPDARGDALARAASERAVDVVMTR